MVRHRIYMTAALGKFRDAIKYWEDLNTLRAHKGWARATLWSPIMGDFNQIVAEYEYPHMAAFTKETEAFQSDSEAMDLFRKGPELAAGSWPRDEILEEAPHIA